MVLRAREVMTRRVVTVFPDTTVERAVGLIEANHFGALPVVDDRHRLLGVVTTLDLLRAGLGDEAAPGHVGAVMTADPMFMTPSADVRLIAHRLRRYGELRLMPIVERGLLVGVVTRGDLLRPPAGGGPAGRLVDRLHHPRRTRPTARPPRAHATGATAGEIMTPLVDVVCVDETTPTDVAAALLREHRFSDLPVIDDDLRLVGVISEADLVPDRLRGRRTPSPGTVGPMMTTAVVTVRASTPIEQLTREVVARRLRLVPVVDAEGRFVGVVGRSDLLRARTSMPA